MTGGRGRDTMTFVGVAKIKTEFIKVIGQGKQFGDEVREPKLRLFELGIAFEGR